MATVASLPGPTDTGGTAYRAIAGERQAERRKAMPLVVLSAAVSALAVAGCAAAGENTAPRVDRYNVVRAMLNEREQKKMVLAKPTPPQLAWQEMEIGMFIHFMPSTWSKEGSLYDLARINPEKLDTDQWVRVAESMGAKYIIFVAKHGPGFCYWQTDTTPYGVKQLAWRGGKGDIVADLAKSCRKRGIKLGVYITAWDDYWGAGLGGVIGASDAAVRYKLIRGKELGVTPEAQEHYNRIYRQQITDLLTHYGEIGEVWFDGGVQIPVTDIIQKYAPNAVVFGAPPDYPHPICWCGNEDGYANYPLWNYVGDPYGAAWFPVECDTTMRYGPPGYPPKWGWEPNQEHLVRSLDQLMDVYYKTVGRGAVLLLNLTPDPTGLIPEPDAKRAAEFGAEVKRCFGKNIAHTKGKGNVVELYLGKPTWIDHVVIMEDITDGQRVLEYVVDGMVKGEWKEICRGQSIGHKRIEGFEPVEVSKVRLRCLKSIAEPLIRQLALYHVGRYNTCPTGGLGKNL